MKEGIEVLQSLKVAEIVFTGGNPLLRSDMGEILKYARDRFPLVAIYDNGSLAWRRVKELKYADVVCISLNTLNPQLQDEINGVPGAFHSAMKSIETLKAERVNVAVDITVSGLNLEEVASLIEFFGSKDIPVILSLYSDLSLPEGLIQIGQPDEKAKINDKKRVLRLLEDLKRLRKIYPVHLDEETLQALQALYLEGVRRWRCKALSSFFVVDASGRVSGCHLMPPIASLKNLPEEWGSFKFQKLREAYSQCERCLYLCYLAYSLLDTPLKLIQYGLEYGFSRLQRFLLR